MTEYPQISVLIPVFNDEQRLKQCLEALERQTYPKRHYEVIVVDNGSTDDLKSVVSRFQQAFYCYESKSGSYAARNYGLTIANGEIMAFTDSDCIPANDWLEQGVLVLKSNPDYGLIGGAISLFYKDSGAPTAVELYESLRAFPQRRYIEQQQFAATANVFTHRRVFDDVGVFNAELKSGGDSEWGKRVAAAGYKLHYAEEVKIAHPARSTYAEYYVKTIRVMSGLPAYRYGCESKARTFWRLLKSIVPPISGVKKIWAEAHSMSYYRKIKVATVVVFLHYIWSFEGARLRLKGPADGRAC